MTRDASRTRRSLPAIATLTIAAASLAGCSWMSPVQTMNSYAPADGIDASVGSVTVNNLLVVTHAKGSAGAVVGSVTNSSDREASLVIGTRAGGGVTKKVPAHGVLNLQQAGVTLPAVDAAPGAMTTVTLATADSGSHDILVPVLAQDGIYASITPSAPASPAPATTTPAG